MSVGSSWRLRRLTLFLTTSRFSVHKQHGGREANTVWQRLKATPSVARARGQSQCKFNSQKWPIKALVRVLFSFHFLYTLKSYKMDKLAKRILLCTSWVRGFSAFTHHTFTTTIVSVYGVLLLWECILSVFSIAFLYFQISFMLVYCLYFPPFWLCLCSLAVVDWLFFPFLFQIKYCCDFGWPSEWSLMSVHSKPKRWWWVRIRVACAEI